MNIIHAFAALLAFAVLTIPVLAAFTKWRHPLLGLPTLALTGLAGLGSYYSIAESASLPWAVGYGLVGVLGAVSTLRHLTVPRRSPDTPILSNSVC